MPDCCTMPSGRGLFASRWLTGALLFAACYWILDLAVLRCGVPHPLDDTWDAGVIARLLLDGEWMRTLTIHPPLWGLRDPTTLTVPVLVHGPLLPLLLAPALAILGPALMDHLAWGSAAFALLTGVPLYRLAARHFGAPVGAAAFLLFTVSPLTLWAVHHYPSALLGAFFLTLTLDLLARERPHALAGGLSLGCTYLARPEALLAAPVLAGLAEARGASARGVFLFLGTFTVSVSWWWWHHWAATGSPFLGISSYLLICFSPAHPEYTAVRDFGLTPDRLPEVLRSALPDLWLKWANHFPRAARHVLAAPTSTTGWLVVPGAVVMLRRKELRRWTMRAALLALVPVAAMIAAVSSGFYLVPLLPLYALAAALGARWLFERLPPWAHRPRAWIGGLMLLVLPSVAPALREGAREARRLEAWLAFDRQGLVRLSDAAHRGRLVFSDTPDFVAWTTGRPAVWVTREEYARLYSVSGAPRRLPAGLPAATGPADAWFHRDPVDPAKSLPAASP